MHLKQVSTRNKTWALEASFQECENQFVAHSSASDLTYDSNICIDFANTGYLL